MTDEAQSAADKHALAQKALRRLELIGEAREHLLPYVQLTMPDPEDVDDPDRSVYEVQKHHRLIAEALERVARGECLRLAISIGPQFGKSELTSRRFPAWYMGKFPHRHLIFATYSDTFAKEFGGEVSEIMGSPAHKAVFPKSGFRKGYQAKDYMVTNKGGRMAFIGRGGAGSGKPADLEIIDDPIKNAEEAESPATIEALHQWFSKVMYARAKATTAIVIIHTRWIEDDLIGRLCDPEHPDHDPELAREWTHINIPAVLKEGPIAEAMGAKLEAPSDPLVVSQFGREPMASLWPDRFDLRHLATASKLNPRGFQALYMGKPTPDDGDYFKADWLLEYQAHDLPRNLRKYGASDHAVTKDQTNDANVLGCVGVDEKDDIWVLPDLVWEQMETDRVVEEMLALMKNHQPSMWWMESELISKSFGPFLRRRQVEESVYTLVDPVTPSRDKRVRARAIQGRMAMKKVHFPAFAPWWRDARAQLLKFPYATHDDFVDWLSWIGLGLTKEVSAPRDVPANDGGSNVIQVGSMAWIKREAERRRRRQAQQKAVGGW